MVNDISPLTCFIVDKLMAFNKEDRFSSYPELMATVEQAQEEYARGMQETGLTWAERRASDARRARRRKHRLVFILSLASLAVLALGDVGRHLLAQSRNAASAVPPVQPPPWERERPRRMPLPWNPGWSGASASAICSTRLRNP